MLQTPAGFTDALKTGDYERVTYVFLRRRIPPAMADDMFTNQPRATADGRWAEADVARPTELDGVTFANQSDIRSFAPPREQVLAGRDLAQLRIADPNWTWRAWIERYGQIDHQLEVLWDFLWGTNQHFITHLYTGLSRTASTGEDEEGRYLDISFGGPFSQMNPNLSFTLTANEQKARRDPQDTSLDELEQAWKTYLGRKTRG